MLYAIETNFFDEKKSNSYILADSMEFPIGKKLPLWVVGLLY